MSIEVEFISSEEIITESAICTYVYFGKTNFFIPLGAVDDEEVWAHELTEDFLGSRFGLDKYFITHNGIRFPLSHILASLSNGGGLGYFRKIEPDEVWRLLKNEI